MNLKRSSLLAVLLSSSVLYASGASYTESFNTDLGAWTTTAHLTEFGFNLGWQNSANASGTVGEAGGLMVRYTSATGDAFGMPRMLDTVHFAGTPLDLTSSISVSGKMYLNDVSAAEDVNFGYFNSADPSDQRLIMRVLSPGTSGSGLWRFRTAANGTSGTRVTVADNTWNNAALTFTLTWTPTGGGAGSLSGTVFNGANSLALPSAVVAASTTVFDSFGMWVDSAGTTAAQSQNEFFDDVTYTVTVIPEPAAGLLVAFGLGLLAFRRRK